MELLPFVLANGWGAGVNAYATLIVLNLGGRAGLADIPAGLESNAVLLFAGVMFAIEFVTDKIPYVDHIWDTVHTVIRPTIAAMIGYLASGDADTLEQAFAATGASVTALASHSVKASLRAAINLSPDPVTTVTASLGEDFLVAGVVFVGLTHPWLSATLAMLLLAGGAALSFFLARRARRKLSELKRRAAEGEPLYQPPPKLRDRLPPPPPAV